jgi:4-amino-4-deoxy-L-arabinose transferase-like glycosyltransferase
VRDRASRTAAVVAAILLASLAVRIALVLAVPAPPVTGDAAGYDAAARRILAGRGFAYPLTPDGLSAPLEGAGFGSFLSTRPNAFTMPGYAYLLATLWRVTGVGDGRWQAARLVNCVLSVLSLLLLYLIARRLAGERAGLIALAGAALFPPFLWVVAYVLTESLFTFLLLAFVLVTLVALERGAWPLYAASGALLAACTLVRPVAFVWVPFVAAWMLLSKRYRFGRFLALAGITALAFVLAMAPWWVRNVERYGHPVWLTTASGHPLAGSSSPSYRAGGRPTVDYPARFGDDDEALGAYWSDVARRQIGDIIATDPWGYARIKVLNTRFALLHPWPEAPPPFAGAWMDRWARWMWYAVLALFCAGLIARRRDSLMWVVAALPVAILAAHMTTLVLNRYLFPAMWVAFVPAAAGLEALVRRARGSRAK